MQIIDRTIRALDKYDNNVQTLHLRRIHNRSNILQYHYADNSICIERSLEIINDFAEID